jgi:hypothetical protein
MHQAASIRPTAVLSAARRADRRALMIDVRQSGSGSVLQRVELSEGRAPFASVVCAGAGVLPVSG